MRIAYLYFSEYPWDVRVEKICRTLTQAGHEVHILARNRKREPAVERRPEGTVHRLPSWPWLGRKLDAALSFPAFASPRWIAHLSRVVRRTRADVIIARDLPLCPTAIWVGRALGVPVVLDMAENYPAFWRQNWELGRKRPADYLLRNPKLIAAVERYCVPRVDRVMVVVDESAERLRRMGVPAERIALVSNTPPAAVAAESRPRRGVRLRYEDDIPLVLSYLGVVEVSRGIDVAIEAVAVLRRLGRPARLDVVGGGKDLEFCRARVRELSLDDASVTFHGQVPHPQAIELMSQADVGLLPHRTHEMWNTTIPNKLFDYMAAGMPVVTADAVPFARIVRETGAGEVFPSGDPEMLARAVERFYDPAERERCGQAGRRAVLAKYNWERDAARMLECLESLCAPGARHVPAPALA
jgi:glycosyltransferase involved in cell wall biosynthesis